MDQIEQNSVTRNGDNNGSASTQNFPRPANQSPTLQQEERPAAFVTTTPVFNPLGSVHNNPITLNVPDLVIRQLDESSRDAVLSILTESPPPLGSIFPNYYSIDFEEFFDMVIPIDQTQNPFFFGVFLKDDNQNQEEGELIGLGGEINFSSTPYTGVTYYKHWPNFDILFKRQYWDTALPTLFGKEFLRFWWSSPQRDEAHIYDDEAKRDAGFLVPPYHGEGDTPVTELLTCFIAPDNHQVARVLEEMGFDRGEQERITTRPMWTEGFNVHLTHEIWRYWKRD
ncbi:hypothetical protein CDD81_8142 [Ophiocordyceps australis]|uniref:N-acetyltransferase domain-containing protein n=1 Tax=Ophiocordyceps australis TaxID=1399860 RepID=A0A2C5Y3V1_9HYPO|nr:hypothetical protein CDD81_8142 [Ophiocordyceps australis]